MAPDRRWEQLLDPGRATDFFEDGEQRPEFDLDATDWHLGQAWWCSEIARAIYRRGDRSGYFARAGLREARFFDAGSTQGALVLAASFAVLVFRGTADLRDWLTNLRVAPTAWPPGGRVHEGFARGLDKVWADAEAELQALAQPVFVTGHSLGGALATLAAASYPFAAAYTFGAPRVGDEAFWPTLRGPLHRVVNDRDIVPNLPPRRLGYSHGGVLHHITGDGTVLREPSAEEVAAAERTLDNRRWFEPHEGLSDHAPINYSNHLRAPTLD